MTQSPDGAGSTAFGATKSLQPAPLLYCRPRLLQRLRGQAAFLRGARLDQGSRYVGRAHPLAGQPDRTGRQAGSKHTSVGQKVFHRDGTGISMRMPWEARFSFCTPPH
jgi:hypothetical protein